VSAHTPGPWSVIYEVGGGPFMISLAIAGEPCHRPYRVSYGKQTRFLRTYSDAAHELGCCILHMLACDGMIPEGLEGGDL
jgi:hypothetical protein